MPQKKNGRETGKKGQEGEEDRERAWKQGKSKMEKNVYAKLKIL